MAPGGPGAMLDQSRAVREHTGARSANKDAPDRTPLSHPANCSRAAVHAPRRNPSIGRKNSRLLAEIFRPPPGKARLPHRCGLLGCRHGIPAPHKQGQSGRTTGFHLGEEFMRRLTVVAAAFCAALLTGSGAFAQVPADPNNPNEAIPDAMSPMPYGEPITLENAKKVAAAAQAEMQKRNWKGMCIAVVGPSGDLVYFEKDDSCQYASVTISQHKARTAARYRRPTVVFERLVGRGAFFAYIPTLDDVIASRGGNPIVVGGKVIGAIGASGGTGSQDDVISQAGAAALK
jgi:uncharacterized protein GlcG (DUF336 family)